MWVFPTIWTTVCKKVAGGIPPSPAVEMEMMMALKDHQIPLCHGLDQSWLEANSTSGIFFKMSKTLLLIWDTWSKSFKMIRLSYFFHDFHFSKFVLFLSNQIESPENSDWMIRFDQFDPRKLTPTRFESRANPESVELIRVMIFLKVHRWTYSKRFWKRNSEKITL